MSKKADTSIVIWGLGSGSHYYLTFYIRYITLNFIFGLLPLSLLFHIPRFTTLCVANDEQNLINKI